MLVSVIIYHKNINNIYKEEWIDKCIYTILNQTYNEFTIYELNYGSDNFNICEKYKIQKHLYFNIEMNNHVDAMNYLLDKCLEDDMDIVFNINIDDYYDLNRFKIQIDKIKDGYDIVSSNFYYINNNLEIINKMNMSDYNIRNELIKDHNVIAHPSVCYSKKFIKNNKYGYTIPREDLDIWKSTINEYKFYICPEFLLYYRIHNNQISTKK